MNLHLYKKAMDEISVDAELMKDTANKMRLIRQRQRRAPTVLRIAAVCCLAPVILAGALLLTTVEPDEPSLEAMPDTRRDSDGMPPILDAGSGIRQETTPETHEVPPQIERYYTPVSSIGVHPDDFDGLAGQLKPPRFPTSYEELKQQSGFIILGTVREAGVYVANDQPLNPKYSINMARYIYTVQIDRILSGDMPEQEGHVAAVGETVTAHALPKQPEREGNVAAGDESASVHGLTDEPEDGEIEWRFEPYTFRPETVRSIEAGRQYVFFLSGKDHTGVYKLSWDGFGVFPVDYLTEEASRHSLQDLQDQYRQAEEGLRDLSSDGLLYRLCGLFVMEEWM